MLRLESRFDHSIDLKTNVKTEHGTVRYCSLELIQGHFGLLKMGLEVRGGGGEDFWNTSHVAGLFDGCLHPSDP